MKCTRILAYGICLLEILEIAYKVMAVDDKKKAIRMKDIEAKARLVTILFSAA